ncbi:uncharacterized protein LOC119076695 isoform X1 [Bradysia coprophila]|uniref:uncharacterized protein LOC119076695 isoform X1 n=1 Tax=Bradysia coprophila TaxID=38358 RepID=UPI00187D8E68|nr:uncharacterized protein LOC119076695 isoform X1 [Bradysia coprophila]
MKSERSFSAIVIFAMLKLAASYPSETTTFPTTIPYDPCSSCWDAPVQFTDIWAGQCVPRGEDVNCRCECLSIFCRNNEIIDTTTCRSDGSIADCRCIPIETTTAPPTNEPTTIPTTHPYDPCSPCRDSPVQFTDTWAGQCFPLGDGTSCQCACGSIFCQENEVIDTTTCRADGILADCRCIPIGTTTVDTPSPSEPSSPPTTITPTTIPYDPCSSCRDAPVQFTDIWAGQCVPRGEDINCRCECLSIFCRNDEIIDTTTCRSDGSIADCRCIPIETTTVDVPSPSEPTTFPTTDPYDPCSVCRDAPVQFTDTWAGQCFPLGDGASCQCACGSIFCQENEVIDTTTCRADGILADCRCIPIGTTTSRTN